MTAGSQLGYQQVFSLVLEALRRGPQGQYAELLNAVVDAAISKGLRQGSRSQTYGFGYSPHSEATEHEAELVRQAYWDCVVKGIIVPGLDTANSGWPFYRVTLQGRKAVDAGAPQPYDRDGFIDQFRKTVPGADPVVEGYLIEAVVSFNAGCYRASAVMLGVASEQLVLLLIDAFTNALTDGGKKTAFEKEQKAWQIAPRYQSLKRRLDQMVVAKKLPAEHAETVETQLNGVFELLRRYRNTAGHPNVPGDISADETFVNLRIFIEYARRTKALTDHFGSNDADW